MRKMWDRDGNKYVYRAIVTMRWAKAPKNWLTAFHGAGPCTAEVILGPYLDLNHLNGSITQYMNPNNRYWWYEEYPASWEVQRQRSPLAWEAHEPARWEPVTSGAGN